MSCHDPAPRHENMLSQATPPPLSGGEGSTGKTRPEAEITVVLPVYNEVDILSGIVAAVAAFIRENPAYRAIFVDDGSSDGTPDLLRREVAAVGEDRISCLHLAANGGKGRAVHAGVALASGRAVIFTDGDLAYSFDHFPRLVEALDRHEVVIGSRRLLNERQKNIRLLRRLTGEAFNRLVRLILRLPYRDTQAGLKGFRLDAARAIFQRQRTFDFSFDVELICIARRLGCSVGEIPAHVAETHSYKVSKVRLLRDPFRMMAALLKIWWHGVAGHYR